MTDTVERFSNRVENYARYRPDYPREIIAHLKEQDALTDDSIIADIGCGTGLSTKMFLENGNPVYGIEPNAAMRAAAVEYLKDFPNFTPVDGTSNETTLPDSSIDLVVAAQAFHWFDRDKAKAEFERILRPGGHVVIIWNERQLDTTPFLIEYEQLLLRYATDYLVVRHENITADSVREFLGPEMQMMTFPNIQIFDLEGLKGRMLSSSYMPAEGDAVYDEMIDELRSLFAKHNESGRIKVFYDTNVYLSQL